MHPNQNAMLSQIAQAEVRPFQRTTPPHMHDDLMQEAMIGAWKAMEKLEDWRTEKEKKAWLGRAARSKVLSYLRYVQVRKREIPGGELFRYSDRANVEGFGDSMKDAPPGLLRQAMAVTRAQELAVQPDAVVEATQLARRIDRAVTNALDSLTLEARQTIEARLGMGEAPVIHRRRRDEHVRQGRQQLQHFARLEGLDLDLGAMIACQ